MNSPINTAGAATDPISTPLDTTEPDPRFREELHTISWLLEQVRSGERLPVVEAEAVAHSLYVNMRLDGRTRLYMMPLHAMHAYGAVHALNVSILAMGIAEFGGLDEESVRAIGLAGLLHDIGMVRVPLELLAKAEQLEPDERELIRAHPVEGARIIIESDATLELAAVVAYEHHIRADQSGYPVLTFARESHRVSRMVAVCDTFHALRSPRPFREPWPVDIVFSFLNQRAGFEYDAEFVSLLTDMVRSWS